MAIPRFLRVVICFFLIILMMCSMCLQVYAGIGVGVVGVGIVLVISAVLVASGIVMYDADAFSQLCDDISAKLVGFDRFIKMSIVQGVTYVPKLLVEAIISAAAALNAFNPPELQTATIGDLSYPYYGNLTVNSEYNIANFKPEHFHTLYAGVASASLIGTSTATCEHGVYGVFSSTGSSDFTIKLYRDGVLLPYPYQYGFSSSFVRGEEFGISCPSIYKSSSGRFYRALIVWIIYAGTGSFVGSISGRTEVGAPSISADIPWGKTASVPTVKDGVVSLPGTWVGAKEVAGVPSIPLSIPAGTTAGIGAQTQTGAQSGTATDVGAISNSIAQNFSNKAKLNIGFIDIFPFCIPFDLIRAVKLLAAPPKPPIFDVPIKLPYIGTQNIHIDLTPYSGLAVISRWFLTLAFALCLVAGTSKVIKW